ncbi:MAG: RDD family protein [Candidatus Acidiferrum sp.]
MFCSKCGAALAADTAFCQSCGNPVVRTALPTAAPAMPVAVSPHAGVGAIVYASNVTYAGFWLRFVAFIIDGFIIGLALAIVTIPLFFLMGGAAIITSFGQRLSERPDPAAIGALVSLYVVFGGLWLLGQWLYFAYLESGEKQGTWGKQMLGLYVTDLAGNRISFGRASGRFFAKIITGLIPLGIGYIMAGITERKQALHDMIASCLVLRR